MKPCYADMYIQPPGDGSTSLAQLPKKEEEEDMYILISNTVKEYENTRSAFKFKIKLNVSTIT